jgi:hypothetical protein
MPKNGNYYFGKGGFAYKKNPGGGNHRLFPIGLITGVPANVNNKYISGAGVGAQSTAVRRAKLIHSVSCNNEQICGKFSKYLGLHPKDNGQAITFFSGLGQLGLPLNDYISEDLRKTPNLYIKEVFKSILS